MNEPRPRSSEPAPTGKRNWLQATCCFALAFACLWFVRPSAKPPAMEATPAVAAADKSSADQSPDTKAIRDVQLGDRVAGANPLRHEVEDLEIDPETWRLIALQMIKDDGLSLWIELLRPNEWLDFRNARPGATIELDLHEMGAVGQATVTSIAPCPPIQEGSGNVVAGRFIHESDGDIVELRLEGAAEPTRVTANHPYWSVDRNEFIPAGQLETGEKVDTLHGPAAVASLTLIHHAGLLYNLETTEHVFRVGDCGELVHNTCAGLHHLFPRSLGSRIPYKHASLTHLNEFRHSKLHKRLAEHLDGYTSGGITMNTQRWGGAAVRREFTLGERWGAMDDFYRTYNNGEYYQQFQKELRVMIQHGWHH